MHAEAGGEFIDDDQEEIRKLAADLHLEQIWILRGVFAHYRPGGDGCRRMRASSSGWRAPARAIELCSYVPISETAKNGAGRSPRRPLVARLQTGSIGPVTSAPGALIHATAAAMRGFFLADHDELSLLAYVTKEILARRRRGSALRTTRIFRHWRRALARVAQHRLGRRSLGARRLGFFRPIVSAAGAPPACAALEAGVFCRRTHPSQMAALHERRRRERPARRGRDFCDARVAAPDCRRVAAGESFLRRKMSVSISPTFVRFPRTQRQRDPKQRADITTIWRRASLAGQLLPLIRNGREWNTDHGKAEF